MNGKNKDAAIRIGLLMIIIGIIAYLIPGFTIEVFDGITVVEYPHRALGALLISLGIFLIGISNLLTPTISQSPSEDNSIPNNTPIKMISDMKGLDSIRNDLKGNYALAHDIDATYTSNELSEFWNNGEGWKPIGDGKNAFKGTFDGRGHTIKGLFINRPKEDYVGLFGHNEGKIHNVGLENIEVRGGWYVGGLVGRNGGTHGNSSISHSWTLGKVTGTDHVGGLVGENWSYTGLCYSRCDVNGSSSVGGIIGRNGGTLVQTYAAGVVVGNEQTGGLVGSNNATVKDSYFDTDVSGTTISAGGTGKTKSEMMNIDTYNWNFLDVWMLDKEVGYPVIRH